MKFTSIAAVTLWLATSHAVAGPFASFSDPAGRVIPASIVRWAETVIDYSPSATVVNGFGDPTAALGPAGGSVVSLGDLDAMQIAAGDAPGSITLQLQGSAFDGPGADLAVFENASTFFTDPFVFAELAYVEVSSDGLTFARFPSISLNTGPVSNPNFDANQPENFSTNPRFLGVPQLPETTAIDAGFGRNFAAVNSTNIHNLAGYHPTGFGTPFDFADLANDPRVIAGDVDLNAIRFVRIVDIPGDGTFRDALGNPIFDTWPTTGTGGFDLDAVGAINSVPEPASLLLLVFGAITAVKASCRPYRVAS